MRRLLPTLLLFALATPAYAATAEETCPVIGDVAAKVMEARQSGVIMSTAMANIPADNILRDYTIELVKRAYAVPQYSVEKNRAQAVIEFRNETELECYTSF